MFREERIIMLMALSVTILVGFFLLTSLSSSSFPERSFISSAPLCTPMCFAAAGVANCQNQGGQGECVDTDSGCIHKPLTSSPWLAQRHFPIVAVSDDDPTQCICPTLDTVPGAAWLEWDRVRVYKCTLHCKSHVYSDKKYHEPKFRYNEICP